MLDNITKKRIDDCRDVLVGKVPDPKSQIEQITLALIYKFMDDMDKESVEKFKGKAKFFTGEFAKYGWRKLFDPSLGGKEMLDLYSQALDKLQTNANIPELFRNIFKNAFLPYKDPATLKMFLKHIDEFEYSHSEKLGDAFEYLLSVMGSQGDAGQFRTPRHVIDFITACVNPQKNETIADPACGTAGFLLSAYKHILKQNTEKRLGDKLTPEQRRKLSENFMGYDISPDMVRLSLVNMYLHGFATPQIFEYDTLSSEDRWGETFDVILANPPFMTPKGGIRPHKKFGVQANKAEVLFTDYIAEHLNKNGRAGIVVPNGIVATTQTAYKQLRKLLVEDSLIAVISLPAGCFNPYSGVKTSILLLDKGLAKKTDSILFIKISNDGFDLGAQRREIEKNDLPMALDAFNAFKKSLSEGNQFNIEKYSNICFLVGKDKLLQNKDVVLNGDRYVENFKRSTEYPLVKLVEVIDLIMGQAPLGEECNKEGIGTPFVKVGQFGEIKPIIDEWTTKPLKLAKEGDVLLCVVGATIGKLNLGVECSIGRSVAAIRPNKEKLKQVYLYHLLKQWTLKLREQSQGSAQGVIGKEIISDIEIPLPPLDIQEQIVKEIEGYQKIIDGAKMVVGNYKPTIIINPEWEMVEIKQLTSLITKGSSPTWQGVNYTDDTNGVLFVTSENVGKGELLLDKKKYVEKKFNEIEKRSILKKGDILTNIVGASIGRTAIYNIEDVANINQAVCILRTKNDLVNSIYLTAYLNTDTFIKKLLDGSENNARANVSMGTIGDMKIPLPPLEEQTKIVQFIEQEEALVNANKQLITIFEQKIKDKINEVWGVKDGIEN
jgi:type I restriction enzyme M protein